MVAKDLTPRLISLCFFSDDNGLTCRKGETEIDLPKSGADEPGLVELKDGSVLMIIRTDLGRIYRAHSYDGGSTWTEPEPMDLISSSSPATIKRIPTTGGLLMIWNNSPDKRAPLTAAISKDEGKTWENFKNLEADSPYTYAYTSVTFVNERALVTYYRGDEKSGTWSLKLKIVGIDWFTS